MSSKTSTQSAKHHSDIFVCRYECVCRCNAELLQLNEQIQRMDARMLERWRGEAELQLSLAEKTAAEMVDSKFKQ